MTGPSDAAVAAAVKVWHESTCNSYHQLSDHHPTVVDMWTGRARAALSAALPIIREELAQEIEAHGIGADSGRSPVTGQESPDAHLHAAYNDGIRVSAHVVRGGEGE